MEFKFEPGNYYLAGREQIEGQAVLRIEYYPTHMFNDNDDEREREHAKQRTEGNAAIGRSATEWSSASIGR